VPQSRNRRSSTEVRSLLINAARDLFAERGFGGTTTREIASRAGVDETILFRNFGSKERIFTEAVARPIETFLDGYARQWQEVASTDADPQTMLSVFASSLYDLATENRTLLLAAVPHHLGHGVPSGFAALEEIAHSVAARHGYGYDGAVAVRAAVAMIISMAVFDQALFGGEPLERDRVVAELSRLLASGLTRD
jgi:AcrR family transcriptional regulator